MLLAEAQLLSSAPIVEGTRDELRDIATLRGDEAPEVEALVLADGEPPREPARSTCSFSAGSGDAGTPPGSVGVLGSAAAQGLFPGSRAPWSRRGASLALLGDPEGDGVPQGVPRIAAAGLCTRELPCFQGPAGQCKNGFTMLLQAFITVVAFGRA